MVDDTRKRADDEADAKAKQRDMAKRDADLRAAHAKAFPVKDEIADDAPGHAPEPAAPNAGAPPTVVPGMAPPGQGAQVVLTGDARDAARGGTHGDIVKNTMARDQAIVEGHVAPATTAEAAAEATTSLSTEATAAADLAARQARDRVIRGDSQAARAADPGHANQQRAADVAARKAQADADEAERERTKRDAAKKP